MEKHESKRWAAVIRAGMLVVFGATVPVFVYVGLDLVRILAG